ncbi:unnamed protein product, partial [Prorocentrum cordatum]
LSEAGAEVPTGSSEENQHRLRHPPPPRRRAVGRKRRLRPGAKLQPPTTWEAWATASEALSLRLVPVLDSGRARSPPRSSGKREASAALCESPPPKAAGRGARTRGCPPGARLL